MLYYRKDKIGQRELFSSLWPVLFFCHFHLILMLLGQSMAYIKRFSSIVVSI
ncbi:hypothetical protein HMPREF1988_00225 [Porphyromonas gingivalis F0185]|nr:hypothetical protein HMPREF1988_00225 [Porphyromonas gingivalis F0185]ERJ87089.1 hypothetical protein HMPREF1989_00861 [Porphyromonas gingivalis F0566]